MEVQNIATFGPAAMAAEATVRHVHPQAGFGVIVERAERRPPVTPSQKFHALSAVVLQRTREKIATEIARMNHMGLIPSIPAFPPISPPNSF